MQPYQGRLGATQRSPDLSRRNSFDGLPGQWSRSSDNAVTQGLRPIIGDNQLVVRGRDDKGKRVVYLSDSKYYDTAASLFGRTAFSGYVATQKPLPPGTRLPDTSFDRGSINASFSKRVVTVSEEDDDIPLIPQASGGAHRSRWRRVFGQCCSIQ